MPQSENKSTSTIEHHIQLIDTYVSKIDSNSKNKIETNSNLLIHGNVRKMATDEFKKNITFKNKSIVRVEYNNHLHNNFIKTNSFYYDKNELVCIKIKDFLPNEHNKSAVYKRTIYIKDNQAIQDSDHSNVQNPINELVDRGMEYLKSEYSSLH